MNTKYFMMLLVMIVLTISELLLACGSDRIKKLKNKLKQY